MPPLMARPPPNSQYRGLLARLPGWGKSRLLQVAAPCTLRPLRSRGGVNVGTVDLSGFAPRSWLRPGRLRHRCEPGLHDARLVSRDPAPTVLCLSELRCRSFLL